MTLFRWAVLAASVVGFSLAANSHAQDKDAPRPAPGATQVADKIADKPAEPKRVIEITRSTKPNCDVKPVMTDDEIARCRKAWSR
jgi:hypothetical protein